MPQELKENEKIVDKSSLVTEKTPTIPTPGVGKGTKNKLIWWVLGIVMIIVTRLLWFPVQNYLGSGLWHKYVGVPYDTVGRPINKSTTSTQSPEQKPSTVTPTPDGTSSEAPAKLDPTADWKTYSIPAQDGVIAFQLKYPSTWTYKSVSDSTLFYNSNNNNIFSTEMALSMVDGVDQRILLAGGDDLSGSPKETVGKYTGYSSVVISQESYQKNIVVQNPKNEREKIVFHITTKDKTAFDREKSTLTQILSTFRFTK